MTDIQAKPKTTAELLAEKKKAVEAVTQARIEKHNDGFMAAYLKALDDPEMAEKLVEVDIPKIGKCLFRFPGRVDHAAFSKSFYKGEGNSINIELGPCVTYAGKCAVYPSAKDIVDVFDRYNMQGYIIAALAIKTAMSKQDEEEKKSSSADV